MKSLINEQVGCNDDQRLIVYNDFHFGGYAKMPSPLLNFAEKFTKETAIPLDLVYNAKTMYGLLDLIDKKEIEKGSRILFINTGGRRP
jgi:1-aminocyclopropane-1-carboxylate deaminase